MKKKNARHTLSKRGLMHPARYIIPHYLPQDGMVDIPIYLIWGSWVTNGTTFLSDNRYFEIQT